MSNWLNPQVVVITIRRRCAQRREPFQARRPLAFANHPKRHRYHKHQRRHHAHHKPKRHRRLLPTSRRRHCIIFLRRRPAFNRRSPRRARVARRPQQRRALSATRALDACKHPSHTRAHTHTQSPTACGSRTPTRARARDRRPTTPRLESMGVGPRSAPRTDDSPRLRRRTSSGIGCDARDEWYRCVPCALGRPASGVRRTAHSDARAR